MLRPCKDRRSHVGQCDKIYSKVMRRCKPTRIVSLQEQTQLLKWNHTPKTGELFVVLSIWFSGIFSFFSFSFQTFKMVFILITAINEIQTLTKHTRLLILLASVLLMVHKRRASGTTAMTPSDPPWACILVLVLHHFDVLGANFDRCHIAR